MIFLIASIAAQIWCIVEVTMMGSRHYTVRHLWIFSAALGLMLVRRFTALAVCLRDDCDWLMTTDAAYLPLAISVAFLVGIKVHRWHLRRKRQEIESTHKICTEETQEWARKTGFPLQP